jgi:D-alanyl-D-alanine carboxypeptidase
MKKQNTFRKKNTLTNRLLLILFMVIILLLGILGIIKIRQNKSLDMVKAYDVQKVFHGETGESNIQITQPFAETLCVANEDIGLKGLEINSSEEKVALFNVDDTEVMFAQNMHQQAYPASITKILTAILAIKHGNMDDTVTISKNAVTLEEGSQVCGFKAGDMVTMDELFHGLLVYSGNDAAVAIAEHIGGSEEAFVDMMNEEAKRIGATNTNFVNPHGLHDDNHYTTVYDIYLMLNEALKYQYFVDTMQLNVYNIAITRGDKTLSIRLDATDQYLTGEESAPANVTVLGGKTGTTSKAGSCLAILSQNKYGKPYVSIVLGAQTKAVLYDDMNQLLGKINS